MPMNFPDMRSLEFAAKCHKFRQPNDGESESDYRAALADHVESRDFIEAHEIRTGVGWDQFSDEQTKSLLRRSGFDV
jgi:hypothetical protein